MTSDASDIFERAVKLHRDGELVQAERLYQETLSLQPEHLDAEYLLGTVELQLGKFDDAIQRFLSVRQRRSDVPDLHNNLGVAYKAVGDWENAARSFQEAVKNDPQYHQALFNLGMLMEQRGLPTDAEKCFRHALSIHAADAEIQSALGRVLRQQEKWAEAEEVYRKTTTSGEADRERRVNLAFVLARQEKLDEAAEVYRAILKETPDFAEIHNSLSFLHERRGELEAAVEAAETALELKPDLAEAHNNRGIALRSQHRLGEAVAAFERALQCRSEFALAAFNLGTTQLLAGNYREGWRGYEKRVEALESTPRTFPQPRWTGEPLDGKRLFVFADQGFGDAIQFARFLRPVKEITQAEIVLESQPELVSLLKANREACGVSRVIADGDPPPEFDGWIPLASLPGIVQTTLETLPAETPYLESPETCRPELRSAIADVTMPKPTVGLVWRGNPQQARDFARSLPLRELQPLLSMNGVQFVSLQTGETGRRELLELPEILRPVDAGGLVQDFTETAAFLAALDVTITVDTAAAHLAGALGLEVWTLLCHTPDWRWGLYGERTPWYPTMRLFRQPAWGDWPTVVQDVQSALQQRFPGH